MDSRKLLGFAIGVLLFLATLLFGTYAFYNWKSGNTDVTFNIGDSYFYCETGQNVSETGLSPVLDYQSTTSKYTFKVNNIGKSDTKFSVTLNISEISESLKSTSLKYKLMVDKTGSSSTCDTSSNCTEVASGDFSKMKKGINTIAPSIDLPNNSRYQYYLFIYIDGNMQNDTSMQSGTLKMAIEVCDIIVTLDYNGGNVVDNKEYIKVASLYTGLPGSVSRNTSNVTYDTAGGSSVSNDSVSYTFAGWYLENTFKNKVTASTEVKSTINHTLYAKWNPSKTVTLPTTTKTGYTFAGWYNGSSYVGTAGGSYNPSTSVTLTAHWNANKYTVTLDNQGATTAGTTSVSATYGNAMPSISVPSKSYKVTYNYNGNGQSNTSVNFNYSFGGYYTSTNGGGTQYYKTDGTSYRNYNIASNSTLYAKWTSSSITLPKPTWTGYTFNGWYDESGTKIADGGASYTPKANITLVAHWSANVYKVTLDNQSATVAGTKEVYYQYNTTKTVNGVVCYYYTDSSLSSCLSGGYNITNPSKTGYTFGGYYTSTNGGGTNYINTSGAFINNIYQTAGNRTLYAKWTLSQFQVTYDYATNGGTSATKTSAMVDYGASIDLSPTATKTGWTFVGWNTNKDATSKLSSLTMGTSQVTLYAVYKKTGQVTFNLNGNASFTYNNTKYTSTTAIDLCTMYNRATTCTASVTMPTITASSNTPTIIGWSNASGTHTASYTSGQTGVTLTSGMTWYAQTQKAAVQGKVTFNPNGNTAFTYGGTQYTSTTSINLCTIGATYNGTSQASTCTASVTMPTITASSNTPTIIGWSNASGTHTASYTSGQTGVTLTSGTTWYAQTQKAAVQGKVTFNPNGNTAFTYGGTKYTSTTSINLCTIGATYNGTSQASTCTASVTMPTITASSNTPTIIGWSNASETHSASYTSGQTGVTLTSGTTWYAQTQKAAVQGKVTFNPNGNTAFTYGGTKYTSTTSINLCTIGATYNGTSQASTCTASVTMPTITASSNTPTIIGWSNASGTHTASYTSGQTGVTLTSGTTWYAQTQKAAVQGKVTFNPNGNTAFTYGGTQYTSTTSINLCTIGATYNGTSQASTCTASVTMPTITASSNTPTIIGWSNASGTHTASYTSGQTGVTLTSGTTWYAQTQKAAVQGKVTFNPNGNTAFTYGGTQYTSTTSINLCTIGATYNGTSQASTCAASVTMPTITASSNTPTIIGWSNASGTHTASYTSGQTGVTLTSGTTWYAQTQKAAVQGKVTFNPNGNTAFTYGGTKYTSTTSINLCTIGATYNGTTQATTCTASVTMPTITASSNTPTIIGWSNASGTHTASYTSGQTGVTLTSGTTWYAQTQKVAATLSASFNANGATLSSTTSQSCTLGVVYNGASQATSCTVSAPTITRSGYTVVGFNTSASSTSNHSAYSTSTGKITLSTSLNGVTWYAVTYQSISASFYYYNSGIKSTSANCNRYNTSTSCTVTVPLSTFNTTKSQYGGSYVGYGAVNTVGTNTSSTTSISGNTTYYVSYRGNVTEYYQNTSRTIYRNSYFTSTSAMSTVLSTSNTGTSSYSPSSYTKDSVTWSWYGYATSSSTGTRTYSSVSVAAPTTTTTLYTLYSRNVTATFYYYGGSGVATTSGSGTQIANYTGSVVNNGSISIPSAVSSSKGPNSSTYSGVSTSKSSTTTATPTTANTTYYTVYFGKWTATYTKGSNVSSIGSTSNSCNNYYTTNTSSYSGSSCSVTLPTITVGSDYVALGWYNSSNNLIGQPGGHVTLSSNQTFTAKARNLKASDLSYDNSNTGEDCDDAQCMIDKIDSFLPRGANSITYDNSNTGVDCNTVQCMIDKVDKLFQGGGTS